MVELNYVKWIQENRIFLFCENPKKVNLLKKIGAQKKLFNKYIWTISCLNEKDLIKKLQIFNDNNFMFLGGEHGWNPLDIFLLMREKKLVTGEVTEIVWRGKDQILTRTL